MSDSSFILYADQVVSINLGDDGATLTNAGSATISYADSEAGARSAPQGTIAPAASVDLSGTQFLKAASRTELKVEALPPSVGGGSGVILPWETATEYEVGQPITSGGNTYTAIDEHTAGASFAADLAAHWARLPTARAVFYPSAYGAVYDGATDDGPAINLAIDACHAFGGGIVEIEGTFQAQTDPVTGDWVQVNTTISLKAGVHLRGRGSSTDLRGTASPMIQLFPTGNHQDREAISDLIISSPVGVGVKLDGTGWAGGGYQMGWPRMTIENVTVCDAGSHSFETVLGPVFEQRFINCVSMRAAGHGFKCAVTDNFYIGCTAAAGTSASFDGFSVSGANNKFTACKAYGNLGHGFALAGSGRHMLSCCEAQDNNLFGFLLLSANNAVSACTADTNTLAGFCFQASDNALAGCAALYGGGGSGVTTRVGFLIEALFGDFPVRNVIQGTSNCPVPVGGSMVGNTVLVRNGESGYQRPAYAAALTPDPYQGGTVQQTLTGNVTINPPTASGYIGQRLRFIFTQDATGGRTMTFGAAYRTNWTPDTAASKTNIIEFEFNGRHWLQVGATTGLTYGFTAITDDFDRADDVTLGTATTGQAWTNYVGGAQIVSNEARGGGTGFLNFQSNVVAVESSTPDATISVKLVLGSNNGEGIAFRVVDANNYWVVNNLTLQKKVAGVLTSYGGAGMSMAAGDILGVILSGPSITLTKNGVPAYTRADADLVSATKHGLHLLSTSDRLEDFSIV